MNVVHCVMQNEADRSEASHIICTVLCGIPSAVGMISFINSSKIYAIMSNQDTSKYYVDENVVRITAAQAVIITIITLVTQSPLPALLLAGDFALRAFTSRVSPLAVVSKAITHSAGIQPRPVFAAPKRFAAGIGFVFALGISLMLYFQLSIAAYIIGGVLVFCAVLESVFKICLGCYVYNWLVAPLLSGRN